MSKPANISSPRSTIFAETLHQYSVADRCDAGKFPGIIQRAVQAEASEQRTLKAAGIADAAAAYDLIHDGGSEKIRGGIGKVMAHGGYWTLIGGLPVATFGEAEVVPRMNAAFGAGLWPSFFSLPLADHPAQARVRIAAAFISKAPEIKSEIATAERIAAARPAVSAQPLQSAAASVAPAKQVVSTPLTGMDRVLAATKIAGSASVAEPFGRERYRADFNRQIRAIYTPPADNSRGR